MKTVLSISGALRRYAILTWRALNAPWFLCNLQMLVVWKSESDFNLSQQLIAKYMWSIMGWGSHDLKFLCCKICYHSCYKFGHKFMWWWCIYECIKQSTKDGSQFTVYLFIPHTELHIFCNIFSNLVNVALGFYIYYIGIMMSIQGRIFITLF